MTQPARGARILALSLALLLAACMHERPPLRLVVPSLPPAARLAAGCWRFAAGERHVAVRVPAGRVLALDTTPRGRPAGDSKTLSAGVLPADSASRERTQLAGWGVDSADARRLHVWLSDGFTGLAFRLTQRADTLEGKVRGYGDVPGVAIWHRVQAVRADCPSRHGDGTAR